MGAQAAVKESMMINKFAPWLLLLSIFNFVHPSIGGACEDKGGSCVDWRYFVCHAGVEKGICPGDSNIRCCLNCDQRCQDDEADWSSHDGSCTAQGGICKLDSNYCEGSYFGGLCGGPANRKCCKAGGGGGGKVYERCELARELIDVHGFDRGSLGNWVCLTQYESGYNTAATNDNVDGSRDYGIFQINDNFWCDPNVGAGADCGISCSSLLDSSITDDVTCAKIIFNSMGLMLGMDGLTIAREPMLRTMSMIVSSFDRYVYKK